MNELAQFFWDFLAGPFLAFLPARWKRRLSDRVSIDWRRAGTLSGLYELIAAVVGLGYWYMIEVPRRMSQIMDAVGDGRIPLGMDDHQVNGAALTFFYLSPLTWLLFFFFFEGAVRLCGAAFTESFQGTLPLYLVERLAFCIRHPRQARLGATVKETAGSIAASVHERVMVAGLKDVPDELEYSNTAGDEWLEIRSSHRKQDWLEPKIVRVDHLYYRLEQTSVTNPPRPFLYRLKRLPAGVPGRKVLLYKSPPPT
jgi:hypothetical protein